jgi:phosphate transport system permease protein
VLELLAGMPTVVLGYFALTFVTPLLRSIFGIEVVPIFNALSAGLVVGVLIVPTIASISEDAMTAVPRALRDGAYGLGASRRHVALRVVFPAALSGITAASLLGFGRAIGETLVVSLAAGNLPPRDVPTLDPFQQVQTMTAYIVQAVGGESSRGSITFQSIFAVGALLFLLTFAINLIAMRVVKRYREVY